MNSKMRNDTIMRYKRLNDYYIIDQYTGQKLDQKRTIKRLNKYEHELRKETEEIR